LDRLEVVAESPGALLADRQRYDVRKVRER
jgi:hypothetical protein